MNIFDGFLLRLTKSTSFFKKKTCQMSIIVRRPHDYLISELLRVFKSQEDVKIKMDDRYNERRTREEPFLYERRQADRRKTKETLIEVIISI